MTLLQNPAYYRVGVPLEDACRSSGYLLANLSGRAIDGGIWGVVNLLHPRAEFTRPGRWWRRAEYRHPVVCTIWYDNHARRADPDERWVIETTHSRREDAIQIANWCEERFFVQVVVEIRDGLAAYETLSSDHD